MAGLPQKDILQPETLDLPGMRKLGAITLEEIRSMFVDAKLVDPDKPQNDKAYWAYRRFIHLAGHYTGRMGFSPDDAVLHKDCLQQLDRLKTLCKYYFNGQHLSPYEVSEYLQATAAYYGMSFRDLTNTGLLSAANTSELNIPAHLVLDMMERIGNSYDAAAGLFVYDYLVAGQEQCYMSADNGRGFNPDTYFPGVSSRPLGTGLGMAFRIEDTIWQNGHFYLGFKKAGMEEFAWREACLREAPDKDGIMRPQLPGFVNSGEVPELPPDFAFTLNNGNDFPSGTAMLIKIPVPRATEA